MRIDRFRAAFAAVAVAGAVALPGASFAQYSDEPFFQHTLDVSRAYGVELVKMRLLLAETVAPPFEEEFAELLEGLPGSAYARFAGTLRAQDAALAEALEEALAAVSEAAEEGGADAAARVGPARDLLLQAYDVVVPPELQETPAFRGALLADLLLASGGVAESWEDAVDDNEPWEMALGWAALQRVKALWSEIEPLASELRREEGEQMIGIHDELFPSVEPPERVAGLNPEEVEAPAHHFTGIIESVVQADLYPGRNFARLADHLVGLTDDACASFAEGAGDLGVESIHAIRQHYRKQLRRMVDLFDPDLNDRANDLLNSMRTVEGASDDPAAKCGELRQTMADVRAMLGG
jgi:hypothetical protein